MTWQRFYKSSTNSPSENWTKPLKGTLSTPEINRKTKALILMSPPFAHWRKHIIFVSTCVTRLFVTGLSWAFKIIALANGFRKNGASLCQSVSIFARVLRQRICNWKRSRAHNEDVDAVNDKYPPSRRDDKYKKSRAAKPKTCKFCGKAHPFEKGKCPAWGAKCTRCDGRNNFATTCTTPTKQVYSLRDESLDDSDVEYMTSIVTQPEMIHASRKHMITQK